MKRSCTEIQSHSPPKKTKVGPGFLEELYKKGYVFGRQDILDKTDIDLLQRSMHYWKHNVNDDAKSVISGGFRQYMIYDQRSKAYKSNDKAFLKETWKFFQELPKRLGLPSQKLIELALLEGPAGTVGQQTHCDSETSNVVMIYPLAEPGEEFPGTEMIDLEAYNCSYIHDEGEEFLESYPKEIWKANAKTIKGNKISLTKPGFFMTNRPHFGPACSKERTVLFAFFGETYVDVSDTYPAVAMLLPSDYDTQDTTPPRAFTENPEAEKEFLSDLENWTKKVDLSLNYSFQSKHQSWLATKIHQTIQKNDEKRRQIVSLMNVTK